jgi:hypothetical protein
VTDAETTPRGTDTATPGTDPVTEHITAAPPGTNLSAIGRRTEWVRRRLGAWVLLALLLIAVAAPLGAVLVRAVTGYNGEPSALGELAEPGQLRGRHCAGTPGSTWWSWCRS